MSGGVGNQPKHYRAKEGLNIEGLRIVKTHSSQSFFIISKEERDETNPCTVFY